MNNIQINTKQNHDQASRVVNLFCQGNQNAAISVIEKCGASSEQIDKINAIFNPFIIDTNTGKPQLGATTEVELKDRILAVLNSTDTDLTQQPQKEIVVNDCKAINSTPEFSIPLLFNNAGNFFLSITDSFKESCNDLIAKFNISFKKPTEENCYQMIFPSEIFYQIFLNITDPVDFIHFCQTCQFLNKLSHEKDFRLLFLRGTNGENGAVDRAWKKQVAAELEFSGAVSGSNTREPMHPKYLRMSFPWWILRSRYHKYLSTKDTYETAKITYNSLQFEKKSLVKPCDIPIITNKPTLSTLEISFTEFSDNVSSNFSSMKASMIKEYDDATHKITTIYMNFIGYNGNLFILPPELLCYIFSHLRNQKDFNNFSATCVFLNKMSYSKDLHNLLETYSIDFTIGLDGLDKIYRAWFKLQEAQCNWECYIKLQFSPYSMHYHGENERYKAMKASLAEKRLVYYFLTKK